MGVFTGRDWVRQQSSYTPYAHVDGIYDLREDLGGQAAFHEGQAKLERIGRFVGLYVASKSLRTDSLFFNKPYPGRRNQTGGLAVDGICREQAVWLNVPDMKESLLS